jgi:hypothetical protein
MGILKDTNDMINEANRPAGITFEKIYKTMIAKMPGKTVNRKDPRNIKDAEPVKITPYEGVRSIVFSAKVWSKDGKSRYNVHIQFMGVEFSDKLEGSDWSYTKYKGKTYYFRKPGLFTNACRVRCNCMDFVHRFAWPNRKRGCLYGGVPKSYRRKTPPPPNGRPSANPSNTIGMCYHIYNVAKDLQSYVSLMR